MTNCLYGAFYIYGYINILLAQCLKSVNVYNKDTFSLTYIQNSGNMVTMSKLTESVLTEDQNSKQFEIVHGYKWTNIE